MKIGLAKVQAQDPPRERSVVDHLPKPAQPVVAGQVFDGTHIFVKYPVNGLQRGRDYYIWIANKDWDGESRLRVTNFYAYVTFHTY